MLDWCPVCENLIPPERYTIQLPPAVQPAPQPTDAPAQEKAPTGGPTKTTAKAGLKRPGPVRQNSRGAVKKGGVQQLTKTENKAAEAATTTAEAPAAPAAPPRQRTVISQEPTPLYCSEKCRLEDEARNNLRPLDYGEVDWSMGGGFAPPFATGLAQERSPLPMPYTSGSPPPHPFLATRSTTSASSSTLNTTITASSDSVHSGTSQMPLHPPGSDAHRQRPEFLQMTSMPPVPSPRSNGAAEMSSSAPATTDFTSHPSHAILSELGQPIPHGLPLDRWNTVRNDAADHDAAPRPVEHWIHLGDPTGKVEDEQPAPLEDANSDINSLGRYHTHAKRIDSKKLQTGSNHGPSSYKHSIATSFEDSRRHFRTSRQGSHPLSSSFSAKDAEEELRKFQDAVKGKDQPATVSQSVPNDRGNWSRASFNGKGKELPRVAESTTASVNASPEITKKALAPISTSSSSATIAALPTSISTRTVGSTGSTSSPPKTAVSSIMSSTLSSSKRNSSFANLATAAASLFGLGGLGGLTMTAASPSRSPGAAASEAPEKAPAPVAATPPTSEKEPARGRSRASSRAQPGHQLLAGSTSMASSSSLAEMTKTMASGGSRLPISMSTADLQVAKRPLGPIPKELDDKLRGSTQARDEGPKQPLTVDVSGKRKEKEKEREEGPMTSPPPTSSTSRSKDSPHSAAPPKSAWDPDLVRDLKESRRLSREASYHGAHPNMIAYGAAGNVVHPVNPFLPSSPGSPTSPGSRSPPNGPTPPGTVYYGHYAPNHPPTGPYGPIVPPLQPLQPLQPLPPPLNRAKSRDAPKASGPMYPVLALPTERRKKIVKKTVVDERGQEVEVDGEEEEEVYTKPKRLFYFDR
ncbi:hypothetical protein FRC00_003266 [Tulasnella sp. 408]|nr:hypothetical protein FRC00_003266 [Tulasnella sp. 408]